MSINIGTVKHKSFGTISLEISNDDDFVKRVKEINRELPGTHAENMKLWTIRVISTDKISAKIRHLMEGASGPAPPETEVSAEDEVEATPPLRPSATTPEDSTETQQATSIPSSPNLGASTPPPQEQQKPKRRVARRGGRL